jgi:hypothetical protein
MDFNSVKTQDPPLPVAISLIFKDVQVFTGDNEKHVTYTLLITNATKLPVRIFAVKINGDCQCTKHLFEYIISGQTLTNEFSSISTTNTDLPEDPLLQPNAVGVVYVFLDFPNHVPNQLHHQIIVQVENDPDSLQSIILDPVPINKCAPIVIGPPLRGDKWIVGTGLSDFSSHRRSTFILNGEYKLPEKTAVDFLKYGPKGLYDGDPLKNENWYAYGSKIYAPADGEVIGTMDGIPQNIPTNGPNYTVTSKNIGGNYVLIKFLCQEAKYAFFAHMIPGSLKVKIGDKVRKGQVLGLLGNSGNSGAPHLHFQISNKPYPIGINTEPSPINCQGVPWTFDKFIKEEYIRIDDSILGPGIPANVKIVNQELIKNQILLADNLVSF